MNKLERFGYWLMVCIFTCILTISITSYKKQKLRYSCVVAMTQNGIFTPDEVISAFFNVDKNAKDLKRVKER